MRAKESDTHRTILIVDDDDMHRHLASEALKGSDYTILEASDGSSALAMARQAAPDLVLLDAMMPGLDGFGCCQAMRRDHDLAEIPVIMVTSLDDHASIERAFDAGATGFLTKPINWNLLVYHVRYAIRANETEQELRKTKELLELARAS